MTDWNEKNKSNELDEQELEQATGGTSFYGRGDDTPYVYCRCTKCGDEQRFKLFNPKMCMKCGGLLVEI